MATQKDKHRGACAAWRAKLERSLAEKLDEEPESYIEAIQKFTAAAGPHRVVIEGDNGEGNGAIEYVDAVILDSEYIALFEYDDDPGIGTVVNVLHISNTVGYIGNYEDRLFPPKDIKKLNNFHEKHLKLFKQCNDR